MCCTRHSIIREYPDTHKSVHPQFKHSFQLPPKRICTRLCRVPLFAWNCSITITFMTITLSSTWGFTIHWLSLRSVLCLQTELKKRPAQIVLMSERVFDFWGHSVWSRIERLVRGLFLSIQRELKQSKQFDLNWTWFVTACRYGKQDHWSSDHPQSEWSFNKLTSSNQLHFLHII